MMGLRRDRALAQTDVSVGKNTLMSFTGAGSASVAKNQATEFRRSPRRCEMGIPSRVELPFAFLESGDQENIEETECSSGTEEEL